MVCAPRLQLVTCIVETRRGSDRVWRARSNLRESAAQSRDKAVQWVLDLGNPAAARRLIPGARHMRVVVLRPDGSEDARLFGREGWGPHMAACLGLPFPLQPGPERGADGRRPLLQEPTPTHELESLGKLREAREAERAQLVLLAGDELQEAQQRARAAMQSAVHGRTVKGARLVVLYAESDARFRSYPGQVLQHHAERGLLSATESRTRACAACPARGLAD